MKFKFLAGNDKGKVFTVVRELTACVRTEGCYTVINEDCAAEMYVFPSEFKKYGYTIVE